jgi:hypothetical protein
VATHRLGRIAPTNDERAALTLGFQSRLSPFDIANRVRLGHEQAQALGSGPHGPAILCLLDDETSRCCGRGRRAP